MLNLPFSPACERNKNVILSVISPYLSKVSHVLEIGTGSAQHAIHFAQAFPALKWQTSDQSHYLDGIHAQIQQAALSNIAAPIELDVNQPVWLPKEQQFDLVYTANTFHIMSQQDVEAFFLGLPAVISNTAYLVVYGPFKYAGKFTSESNQSFDSTLRSRDCGSAIRSFEFVDELANQQDFHLFEDYDMPANNQCLVWQKRSSKDCREGTKNGN